MPLFTKCLKCGGWKRMPEDPVAQDALATGMIKNMPQAPKNLCSCDEAAAGVSES